MPATPSIPNTAGISIPRHHRAQGVALAAALDVLENQIRGKTTEIRDNRLSCSATCHKVCTAEALISLAEDAEIDAKIVAKEQELQAVRQAAQASNRKRGCLRSPFRSSLPRSRPARQEFAKSQRMQSGT